MKIGLSSEMREIDRKAEDEYGIPAYLLMENAGRRAAEAAIHLMGGAEGKKVCLLAGSGNNGGDAFAAARHLQSAGARPRVFFIGNEEHMSEAAKLNRDICDKMGIEIYQLSDERQWDKMHVVIRFSDCVVDGVLGTGFSGSLRDDTAKLMSIVNDSGCRVLSIDIPTGVAADTGAADENALKADMTITLGMPKPGHMLMPGAGLCGEVLLDGIGLPIQLLESEQIMQEAIDEDLVRSLLIPRPIDAYKGMCGSILVVAGSRGMTGAAALSSEAALRAGAGISTLAIPESLNDIMEQKLTEVMTVPVPECDKGAIGLSALPEILDKAKKQDAVLIGPGLGRAEETMELVRRFVVETDAQVVIDADAIFAFRKDPDMLAKCHKVPVLTPHPGELAGLLDMSVADLRADLLEILRMAAKQYNAIFVAKSECTIVVYPDGRAYFYNGGNPGMATAGAGDVLAGTIAGLWKGTRSDMAPVAGVYIHGSAGNLAAEHAGVGLMAGDILRNIPVARTLLEDNSTQNQ